MIRLQLYNQVTGLLAGIQVGDAFLTLEKTSGRVPVDGSSVKFATKPALRKPPVAASKEQVPSAAVAELEDMEVETRATVLDVDEAIEAKRHRVLLARLDVEVVPKVALLKSSVLVPRLQPLVRSLTVAQLRFTRSILVPVAAAVTVVLLLGLIL